MHWLDAWAGFGMRGNSSRPLQLDRVRVPTRNLLGEPGDRVWYVFEVVAPFFLMAMAGTYGYRQAALDEASVHLRSRRYSHSGEALRDVESLQVRYGELWTAPSRAARWCAKRHGAAMARIPRRCRSSRRARRTRRKPQCSWPTRR